MGDVVVILKCNLSGYVHEHFFWYYSRVNATEHLSWYVNIGSRNGLVPNGTKPLHDPRLKQCWSYIYGITTHNELSQQMQPPGSMKYPG